MKVGNSYDFIHRKSPYHPIVTEKGKVLGFGTTDDGMDYVQADVGSFTKKFIINKIPKGRRS